MTPIRLAMVSLLVIACFGVAAARQVPRNTHKPDTLKPDALQQDALKGLAFLSGRWTSQSASEVQEENWSPAIGDSMTGSFRVVEHSEPVFYEFWAVELEDNRPVLKLKHFNADLVGWEDKAVSTRMPLVSNNPNDAVFSQPDGSVTLHYQRSGDRLTCLVHHVAKGKSSDETFVLDRAP